ncbi:MAG: hypothetical protein HYV07_14295 [Deltaproteobacteria bacterium]|nr:hypothetical protein [Deltaproteobacteria bacterium]
MKLERDAQKGPGLSRALDGLRRPEEARAKPNPSLALEQGDRLSRGGAPVSQPTKTSPLVELPPVKLTPASPDGLPPAEGVVQGMWGRVQDFLSGSTSTREAARARKLTTEVSALAPKMAALSDAELKAQTPKLKQAIADAVEGPRAALEKAAASLTAAPPEGREAARIEEHKARVALYRAEKKALDAILPEAFATCREAARRSSGMFHYDVQVMGGVLMHNGLVAEMYTGEGKTLAATMPAYLNALAGHGFHVVTVNDYLARRDAMEMSSIYGYLGMSVGVLQSNHSQYVIDPQKAGKLRETTGRRESYEADITYGTASEFGFDYLRDNGVADLSLRIQRPLYGALLDEIDSLLIDEARIPLIIAEGGKKPDTSLGERARDVVEGLDWKADVEWDMEEHWVSLTDAGFEKVSKLLETDNLYAPEHMDTLHEIQNALTARFLMRKDEHYTIIDGEIRTVGLSGHAYAGRRFMAGLHQALELKERVEVKPENVTKASITMRDFLTLYGRAGGMTGTALSAKEVFKTVYNLDVARVPTRKPLIRVDYPDKCFATVDAKLEAFANDLKKAHEAGRPVLVGVEYTNTAERLGEILKERGVPCNVLGAKSDGEEASIIAQAGRVGAVTVATTRGGRGVDIKLGGDAKGIAQELVRTKKMKPAEALAIAQKQCAEERAKVLSEGGLLVMSFEHLDSRRRDDQLRGRAGRQGDPGATAFYTSVEDPIYDGMTELDKLRKGEAKFDVKKAPSLTERALDRSENQVNGILSQSLPYDVVTSRHRHQFYQEREDVLTLADCRGVVRQAIDDALSRELDQFGDAKSVLKGDQAAELYKSLSRMLPLPPGEPPPNWTERPLGEIKQDLDTLVGALLTRRDEKVGEEIARVLERDALVRGMDEAWSEYLDAVMAMRDGIGLRAYGQKDPKLEFQMEASQLYNETIAEARIIAATSLLTRMPSLPGTFAAATERPPAKETEAQKATEVPKKTRGPERKGAVSQLLAKSPEASVQAKVDKAKERS